MSAATPDRESHARALLAAHPDGRTLATAPFQPIAGGAFNRCWRVDMPHGAYFVRIADMAARRLGADWASEAALLAAAGDAGLAPRPLLAVPDDGLLVCEFLPGDAPTAAEARVPARLQAIGRLLRAVHGLPASPAIRHLDFEAQARALEAQVDLLEVERFHARSVAVFRRLAPGRRPAVPCHNDVHAANLLECGTRLVLVDWEYCGIGDPVFDLASLASHLALDAEQSALMLEAYGSQEVGVRLVDAVWAYDYVQWLWYRAAARGAGDGETTTLIEAALTIERRLESSRK